MSRRVPSRRFVVDTDIARAASTSDEPVASACRGVLETLRDVCHTLVLAPNQRVEWQRHQSRWTRLWLNAMLRMGKCRVFSEDPDAGLTAAIDAYEGVSARDRAELVKDEHLLELALVTDLRLLSKDEHAYRRFKRLVAIDARIGQVHWGNPTRADEDVLAWLQHGAPDETTRCIGTRPCPLDGA